MSNECNVLWVACDALRPAERVRGEHDGAAETDVVLQRVFHARHLPRARQTAQLPAELRALRETCQTQREIMYCTLLVPVLAVHSTQSVYYSYMYQQNSVQYYLYVLYFVNCTGPYKYS